MARFLLLHGPNLNLLGSREPSLYGHATLTEINHHFSNIAQRAGHLAVCFQSNTEGVLIDRIHSAASEDKIDFIVFNPAAFTHTSIALRDALLTVSIPFVEVHLSNIHNREAFRHVSYFSDIAVGVMSGFGALGYELALRAGIEYLEEKIV